MVSEVWRPLCREAMKQASQGKLEVAPRRGFHQDEWCVALSVASRKSALSHHRHPGSATAGSLGSAAFLSQAPGCAGKSTAGDRHRQAAELCCGKAEDLAWR